MLAHLHSSVDRELLNFNADRVIKLTDSEDGSANKRNRSAAYGRR